MHYGAGWTHLKNMSEERSKPQARTTVDSGIGARADVILEPRVVQPLERAADAIQQCLNRAAQALLGRQANDGHWRFDVEADATIPSEYILLQHFLGRDNKEREEKLERYMRRRQNRNGSWSLYHGGPGDMSATVKAYFALKLIGVSPDAPHMVRARHWVLSNGGAETVNVTHGDIVLDPSFNRGNDRVTLDDPAAMYTAVLSGSSVVLQDADTHLQIPVGNGLALAFPDHETTLTYNAALGQVLIGNQLITTTAASLTHFA